jgi:hypothetical protein
MAKEGRKKSIELVFKVVKERAGRTGRDGTRIDV